jgi:hypothetical protein
MASWVGKQWGQIRGNVKFELLKAVFLVFGGSGIIAAATRLLQKIFTGVDSEWFVFGGIFCCSLLVFALALLRLWQKPSGHMENSNRLHISSATETLKLGALWTVPANVYDPVTIELLEIINENEVSIAVTSFAIQYAGANVRVLEKSIHTTKYLLQRSSIGYGNDCVSHWDISDATFCGFFIFMSHANKFTQEATISAFGVDAYQLTKPQESSEPSLAITAPDVGW